MRCYIILLLSYWSIQNLYGQKKLIDSTIYDKWPILKEKPLVSNDGKYISYVTSFGSEKWHSIHTVVSTQSNWKIQYSNVKREVKFSADSKYAFFLNDNDSLIIFNLAKRKFAVIDSVSDVKIPENGSGKWIVISKIGGKNSIVVRDIQTGKEIIINNSIENWLSEDGMSLVSKSIQKSANSETFTLSWINLIDGRSRSLWKGENMEAVVADFSHKQLAFKANGSIWLYQNGKHSPRCLFSENDKLNIDNYVIGNCSSFSKKGDRIYVYLEKKIEANISPKKNAPVIWSYMDKQLQTEQTTDTQVSLLAVINIDNPKIIQLQKPGEFSIGDREIGDKLLLRYSGNSGYGNESNWNAYAKINYVVVNTKNGERQPITLPTGNSFFDGNLCISPDGNYAVYYDLDQGEYISFELGSGKATNLTKGIETSWTRDGDVSKYDLRGIAGWNPMKQSVLIYDKCDIWQLNLSGKVQPKNITNNYGQKHRIVFTIALSANPLLTSEKEGLIFSAFELDSKHNGFFSKALAVSGDPVKLTMGPYLYKIDSRNAKAIFDFVPIKAKNAEIYLLQRQSSTEAPNYFYTTDFKNLKELSSNAPQRAVNWLTTELHNWRSFDGRKLSGILYKPENFDADKKYPLIIHYYERLSDGINSFLYPGYSNSSLDIPTYVSNGYLVFCPDIYYKIGDPMQGTYDAVLSARDYLATLSFVNERKIGLQGFSFGAVQTNYLVTHTNKFAAACSASGLGDWVSSYGSLMGNRLDGYVSGLAANFETGQLRMFGTLWGDLQGYLKNSPVLSVHKVTTPLFLMHTGKDNICQESNILEFFLALRRLGKKTWMVVYPEECHDLSALKAKRDFTTRMRQFFDYYLKDAPPPFWMIHGVTAENRAFGAGLELEAKEQSSEYGLLTTAEQKKADSLKVRKPIIIKLN